jgi:haloalkane dehalogenase
MPSQPSFSEHWALGQQGKIHVREYPGVGPALVLMHGLPDNLHIYDDLVPYLVAAGRRVVTFDFLGFGASDKPGGATYSFAQQLGDLGAVAEGPTARWPEFIELFANPHLRALALAVATKPEVFGWMLDWQRQMFRDALPDDAQKAHFDAFMGPLIADNCVTAPSSAPAFVQMAAQFFGELAKNGGRLARVEVPVKLIWGDADPYFPVAMAEERRSKLRRASLAIVHAGHWLQSDRPEEVAREILS